MPNIFSDEEKKRIHEQLIREGYEMMLKGGIKKMNLEVLAKSAGIAKGTFYNFFHNKQEFIMAIINDFKDKQIENFKNSVMQKRELLSIEEGLEWYKAFINPPTSLVYQMSQEDVNWIYEKIPKEKIFRTESDMEVVKTILSCVKGIREDVDYRIVMNFTKIIGVAIENSDIMYSEVLPVNVQMIVGTMIKYLTGEIG